MIGSWFQLTSVRGAPEHHVAHGDGGFVAACGARGDQIFRDQRLSRYQRKQQRCIDCVRATHQKRWWPKGLE